MRKSGVVKDAISTSIGFVVLGGGCEEVKGGLYERNNHSVFRILLLLSL
jgi:hypothetical protein